MFTSIRKYRIKRGSAEEWSRRVQESFVPMLRQMPGFRSYYLLDGGIDVLIAISMFDSADEAFASNQKAADWVSFVVTDGNLVTGQNPASSRAGAQALLKLLA